MCESFESFDDHFDQFEIKQKREAYCLRQNYFRKKRTLRVSCFSDVFHDDYQMIIRFFQETFSKRIKKIKTSKRRVDSYD